MTRCISFCGVLQEEEEQEEGEGATGDPKKDKKSLDSDESDEDDEDYQVILRTLNAFSLSGFLGCEVDACS